MKEPLLIKSTNDIHSFIGLKASFNPFVSIFKNQYLLNLQYQNRKVYNELYFISIVNNTHNSKTNNQKIKWFLNFKAPHQKNSFNDFFNTSNTHEITIVFHTDLIRKHNLEKSIKNHSFFSYNKSEMLLLEIEEILIIKKIIEIIEREVEKTNDEFTNILIAQSIETILMYAKRNYDKQFSFSQIKNSSLYLKLQNYLENYFSSDTLHEKGHPNVAQCGYALNMSGSYLSDILKTETGKTTKEHIHFFIIEKAKNILLNTEKGIGEIAFDLGFDFPQHLSKLFKQKTGLSPKQYRVDNNSYSLAI